MRVQTPEILLPLVWPNPLSLATTRGISVDVFSSPYLDVSVQAVPHVYLLIQHTLSEYCSDGFPHSDISGSMLICSSPKLFAAYHVLHRLLMPRHSPCALCSLTSSESASVSFRFRLTPKTPLHCAVPPLKSKPACAGLLICKENCFMLFLFSQLIDSPIGSLYS